MLHTPLALFLHEKVTSALAVDVATTSKAAAANAAGVTAILAMVIFFSVSKQVHEIEDSGTNRCSPRGALLWS